MAQAEINKGRQMNNPKPVNLKTPQGTLTGETAGPDNNIHVFKGIPYALPPVGHRRWAPPEPAPGWAGVRLAKVFSPQCLQAPPFSGFSPELESEDCLYLNVWSPAEPSEQKRPVMVWIHGGAFRSGGGSYPFYDGSGFARKGVVLVTINYRTGLFGYLAHPELTAESPEQSSGNYAVLDQIQALKWVQDNIAAFGGDPNQVTIFGESSGGCSVQALMVSPLAKGLFHRAIAQSGTLMSPMRALSTSVFGTESAESLGLALAKEAGVDSLASLRRLPAVDLMRAADTADSGQLYMKMPWNIVDGWVIPDQVYDICRRAEQQDVPLLLGFTANESSVVTDLGHAAAALSDPDAYCKEIHQRYGKLAEDYLAVYPPEALPDSHFDAIRDQAWGWCKETWARFTAPLFSSAYLYFFSHVPPDGNAFQTLPDQSKRQGGAYHAAEIQYVFQTVDTWQGITQGMAGVSFPITEQDRTMADVMSDYWVAFACTGSPNTEGLPSWKAYTPAERAYQHFNEGGAYPEKNLLPGMWELMDSVMQNRRNVPGVGRDYYASGITSPTLFSDNALSSIENGYHQ